MLSAVGFLNVPLSYIEARMKMQPNAFMIRSKGILEKAAITKLIRELSS
jgi:hypothetical protein